METWRLLDTGSLSAAENMALDEVLLELKPREKSPDAALSPVLPPCVSWGTPVREEEIRLDYCRSNGIEINRRLTGGGALYWEKRNWLGDLYIEEPSSVPARFEDLYRKMGRAQPGDSATWGWTPGFDHAMTSRSRAERFPERAAPSFQGRSSSGNRPSRF